MTELYDEEGNAIEAFSKEEVDEKVSEAGKASEEKISELSEELGKEKEKEKNFTALRAKKEKGTEGEKEKSEEEKKKVEDESQTKIDELEGKIEEAKNAGVSKVLEIQRSSAISELAEGDEELAEKIEANYKLINKPEDTDDEVRARARDAYLMSMEVGHEDLIDDSNIIPPSGAGGTVGSSGSGQVSSELKEIGKKFGVSDIDWNKHSK